MQSQSSFAGHGKGLGFLSLDAGGPRGISQLKILAGIMHRLNFEAVNDQMDRPCAVFDMIGGVGSGGFIAILLVVFKLTTEDTLNEFINLSINVLGKEGADAQARTTALREHVDGLLRKYMISESRRLLDNGDHLGSCKLFVPISYKHHVGPVCVLRNSTVRHEQGLNLTIGEALLATLATPPLFASISVFKDSARFEYIGADLTLSNPMQEMITEALGTFGKEEKVACLLSIGCGHPGVLSVPEDINSADLDQFLLRLTQDSERKAQSLESLIGGSGLYHRFSVSSGLEISGATISLPTGEIMSHTMAYLSDASVSLRMDQCIELLKTRDGVIPLEQLKYPSRQIIVSPRLPPVTKSFVMRKEPWQFIERILLERRDHADDESRILVVTGIGGCGKTQLMLKFMRINELKFACSFFIDGSSADRIRVDISRSVRSLGAVHSHKSFEECVAFLSRPSPQPRLLLYDNVDDPDLDLSPLLPLGVSCAIVIISRNHLLGESNPDAHLKLDSMSLDEAVELILHTSNRSTGVTHQTRNNARALAQVLGGLPIALQQARSYMQQTKCSTAEYLERLSSSRQKLLGQAIKYQLDMRAISTYAAFETSFGRLAMQVQKFLRLLSYFRWSDLPLALVTIAAKNHFSKYERTSIEHGDDFYAGRSMLRDIFLRNGEWDVVNLDNITISLQNYSLATVVPGVDTTLLQLHPLVHEWVHSCIPEEKKHDYQSAAILLLALGARDDHTAAAQYLGSHVVHMSPLWDRLHINDSRAFGYILHDCGIFQGALQLREKVANELKESLENDIEISNSLWELASTYKTMGRANEAAMHQEEVLRLRKEYQGERDPNTITASNNLALTYRDLGRLREAQLLQKEVLRLRREVLGERHPDTITASSNLGLTYSNLGQLSEAELLQAEVLKLRKEVLGERHPDTITASNNLALTYRDLGRLDEAQLLQREVLRLRREILGARHPDTITASSNLALIYRDLGQLNDTQLLQNEVLRLMREVLGERHPHTITASGNLAITYCKLGRLDEAQSLQEGVLASRKDILGSRHPDTVNASSNLALTYRLLGRLNEAAKFQEEVLQLRRDILGERHPDTIAASSNLGLTYNNLGHLSDAESLQAEVLELRKVVLGERHPDTLTASSNLGLTYSSMGRLNEAESLQAEVLKSRKEILGERHPDTITASSNLAITYCNLGRLSEAKLLQVEVLKLRKEILGARHPESISASSNLGLTYRELGRLKEAELLQNEVLSLRREVLGERHPDTITASSNLGLTYSNMGRLSEAESLQAEVLKSRKEVLGERHPDTITASNNLALTCRDLGRLKEAETLQTEVLHLRKEVLGEWHLDTIAALSNLAITYCNLGRFSEAGPLQAEVLRLREQVLGKWHLDTIIASSNLALTHRNLGRLKDAATLQEEVLQLREKLLGKRHPDTLTASSNLGLTYYDLGQRKGAQILQEGVLSLRKDVLGERHPDTITALNNLAITYSGLGQLEEAQTMQKEALNMMKEVLGEQHYTTTFTILALVETYISRGETQSAIKLLSSTEGIIYEALGETHPQYLWCQKLKSEVKKPRVTLK